MYIDNLKPLILCFWEQLVLIENHEIKFNDLNKYILKFRDITSFEVDIVSVTFWD